MRMQTNGRSAATYRLPDSLPADLEELRDRVCQVQAGTLSPERFRAFRVPMGIYEQRERGMFMLRVRVPAGGVLPPQMRALANVAERYGNGVLHVTTRQDIQVHRVPLAAVYPAEAALYEAGLATKGGGGNSVRNVTACPYAGVCPHEAFDVAPHAVAVTEFLLGDPLSYQLPRKYKVAFSGCGRDCAGATVNDLGLIASRRDGQEGFAVYVGGGLGARSRVADLLEGFILASDAPLVAEAVKRVFDQHGNRKDKHRARLRFLVERIGLGALRTLYQKQLTALQERPPALPASRPLPRVRRLRPATPSVGPGPGFTAWRAASVFPQRQEGRCLVVVPLCLGDLPAPKLRALADVIEAHGDGLLWTTQTQNVALRWVWDEELPELHGRLAALGLAEALPPVLRDLVACAGASTCRLGICLSRGLAAAIAEQLTRDGLDLARLGDLQVRVNGCPNACGRARVAQIGFSGAARRVGDRLVPHYVVQLGGRVGEGRTRLAEGKATLPARSVPAFLREFLTAFGHSERCPDFEAFLDDGGWQLAADLAAKHRSAAAVEPDKSLCYDWSAEQPFSLAGRGPGECSAGVFDLIEVDLASAREALDHGRVHAAAALAARALLITRGEEPADDREAFQLFQTHFVASGLVDRRFQPLIASALGGEAGFTGSHEDVAALVEAVHGLYADMDDSLRFAPSPPAAESEADATEDFRGVACPLNYVKTKLALEALRSGQILSVLLDEEGARNCPPSAQADGHEVLAVTREGDHWRVRIRKGKA